MVHSTGHGSLTMSRMFVASAFLIAGLAAAATSANAQEARVRWHVMGGYSEPVGRTADYLQGGYLVGGGFSVTPSPNSPLDLRVDLNYSEHVATSNLLNIGQQAANTEIDNGTGSFWSGTANLEYHVPIVYGVRAYGIAGVGAYHSRVELTQQVPFGYGYYYCDPFSGFCDGSGNALVSSTGVTKFGWNAGAGVEFALPYGQSWFIEARYHRISTDQPIELVPITVGYRF
jgi:opacity protein-like surface antigen